MAISPKLPFFIFAAGGGAGAAVGVVEVSRAELRHHSVTREASFSSTSCHTYRLFVQTGALRCFAGWLMSPWFAAGKETAWAGAPSRQKSDEQVHRMTSSEKKETQNTKYRWRREGNEMGPDALPAVGRKGRDISETL
ncbi:hypothetical protein KCP73_03160 [Salmonella enterica subsp. enterica]|nr:hypothetical protein KCP73_03160 [Salmonella enterica subsp. enterica]